MKFYIRANSEKPTLDYVITKWQELADKSGIVYSILSEYGELLFEELFDYDEIDSDAIYDSAIDMAITVLSQKYELSDEAIAEIKGDNL